MTVLHCNFYPRSPCGERHTSGIVVPPKADFYPRSPCGERQEHTGKTVFHLRFLSTLSLRRATVSDFTRRLSYKNFYPRSPCGERLFSSGANADSVTFLSTLSLRRATRFQSFCQSGKHYFYPRSPCGERRPVKSVQCFPDWHFYPRSPCGERLSRRRWTGQALQFLSTLSLRRATICSRMCIASNFQFLSTLSLRRATSGTGQNAHKTSWYFYPRSPCGERHTKKKNQPGKLNISIHALLAESDRLPTALRTPHHIFLSTLSLRRATPTTSRDNKHNIFLSTLSLRRATPGESGQRRWLDISIHALLAESDSTAKRQKQPEHHFYPRSPCGERLATW